MIPKFRAWDKVNKIFTNYKINDDIVYFYEKHLGTWKRDDEIDRFKLMQSTGLKDKNGVEIFEGDIVRNIQTNSVGKVIWDFHNIGYYYSVKRKNTELFDHFTLFNAKNKLEVIGNIYENKDLLEE